MSKMFGDNNIRLMGEISSYFSGCHPSEKTSIKTTCKPVYGGSSIDSMCFNSSDTSRMASDTFSFMVNDRDLFLL